MGCVLPVGLVGIGLIYRATSAENADLISVLVYSAVGLSNIASVSPSSTIFPFFMTMT